MGNVENRSRAFYATGGFFALIGLVLGVADPLAGSVVLAIGFVIVAPGIWLQVEDSKKRKLEQEWADEKRIDDGRAKERARRKDEEMMERWRNRPVGMTRKMIEAENQRLRESKERLQNVVENRNEKSLGMSEQEWIENRVRPLPQRYGVSHRGAEELAGEWLRFLGEEGVEITPYSQDGGADVFTNSYCCQVKNYEKKPVGVIEVRALLGTAVSNNLTPLLFTASRLTVEAQGFCEDNNIGVVEFDAPNAKLFGTTSDGQALLEKGRYSP